MSTPLVYCQIAQLLTTYLDSPVEARTRERLALLVMGMLGAKSASPARIAQALHTLGLSQAKPESIERRVRRIENDPQLTATLCLHPLARAHLALGKPTHLTLILDPTCQDTRVVLVAVTLWYRGRSLPLCWAAWPGNTPLEGEGFWQRIEALLSVVASLLPGGVEVTVLADRAFGTPAFTDLVAAYGWWFIVRVQDQTRCRGKHQPEGRVRALVPQAGQRRKLRGEAFKKAGWRTVSLVVVWGRNQTTPLCLCSNRRPGWDLAAFYRRRYPIEATFRDYKSAGWQWEQGQVRDLSHLERLLVGMALATWIALMVGTQVAREHLTKPPTGRRCTRPFEGKFSLFTLGLQRLWAALVANLPVCFAWELTDWDAPNWQTQITNHHKRAFIFSIVKVPKPTVRP